MTMRFFPDPLFAWAFVVVLLGLLVPTSYIDFRRLKIPKALSLTTLAIGLAFNVARGGWLGAGGRGAWFLGPRGPFIGACDGLLFGLAGFAVGFSLFFLMWLLRTCGGGDVKLFAAIGAWVGPTTVVSILALAVVFVAMIAACKFLGAVLASSPLRAPSPEAARRKRLISFSLPVSLATAVVLLWGFRGELRLSPDGRAMLRAHPGWIGGRRDA